MIYGPRNVQLPAHVYDVDRVEQIKKVVSVNTDAGVVECYHDPVQLNHEGTEAITFFLRFRSIYPIFGGSRMPTLFHCYGRLA